MTPPLRIAHLYPDILRTYGDWGNVLSLARRCEWRGIEAAVEQVPVGEPLPPGPDILLVGGGTDRAQRALGADLGRRREELSAAAAEGTVIIGICGGYQFLGKRYVTPEREEIEGLGLLEADTVAKRGRIIGRVRARANLWGREFELFGFENHGGRTYLGRGVGKLAAVPYGQGNNGTDRTEGAVQESVVGTYLHGPVLPTNPMLADALIERALRRRGEEGLPPLPDEAEEFAREEARRLGR